MKVFTRELPAGAIDIASGGRYGTVEQGAAKADMFYDGHVTLFLDGRYETSFRRSKNMKGDVLPFTKGLIKHHSAQHGSGFPG